MIDWIIYAFTEIFRYLFDLFPTVSFDISAPVGTALAFLGSYSTMVPVFFATFFRLFWVGNVLAYIAVIIIIILRFLPGYKK